MRTSTATGDSVGVHGAGVGIAPRSSRAAERAQVAILVELEAVFCVLASAGLLRHLLVAGWPWYVWLLFAWAIVWIHALVKK